MELDRGLTTANAATDNPISVGPQRYWPKKATRSPFTSGLELNIWVPWLPPTYSWNAQVSWPNPCCVTDQALSSVLYDGADEVRPL